MIEMQVEGIGVDEQSRTLVLLRDRERRRFLPIWIGPAEALAIAIELEQKEPVRPLTHDLMHHILNELNVSVSQVVVSDFRDGTFYATLTLVNGDEMLEIDCRPSDGIALALRARASIFVAEDVAAQAVVHLNKGEDGDDNQQEIDRFMKLIQGVDIDKHFQ